MLHVYLSCSTAVLHEPLEDIDRSGRQQSHRGETDERLGHHQDFGPSGKDGNVSRRKGGAGVKGQEKVVDKAGAPALLSHFFFGGLIEGHLRE